VALNTFKCNCLTPLHFKGLTDNECCQYDICIYLRKVYVAYLVWILCRHRCWHR